MLNKDRIQLDGCEFVVVIETKKIKNIYLRIIDEHTLKITCHPSVPKYHIFNFIESKEKWIISAINKRKESNKVNKVGVKGPYLYMLGKKYYLDIIQSTKRNIIFDKDIIRIYVINNNDEEIMQIFYQFAKSKLNNIIEESRYNFEKYLEDYGTYHPIINIRKMKSKWGVCYPTLNKITINVMLIHFPIESIHYVLWHEYCHFIVPNHSKRFYYLLENKMPKYKEYKEMLR